MLCCTVLLALFAMPALAVSRRSLRHKVDPLAWRLGCADDVFVPPGGYAPRLVMLIRNRVRSFAFAGAGIRHVIRNEHASLIHGAATAVAFGSGFFFDITAQDWRWIVFTVFLAWSAEAFNTAIENVCNLLSPEYNEHIRVAKDVGAGAVLLVSIGAAIIGLLTFWPYLAATFPAAVNLTGLPLSLCTVR